MPAGAAIRTPGGQLELTLLRQARLPSTGTQKGFGMKLIVTIVLSLATAAAAARAETPAGLYTVNQTASSVGFTIYGSMIFKFHRDGTFKDFNGELAYDPAQPSSTHVDLTVYTGSVDMHNAEHNSLMKSPEFFDVERFPTLHFTSSAAEAKPDGTLAVTGDLTIRGVTKRVTIPVKLRQAPSAAAAASGTI